MTLAPEQLRHDKLAQRIVALGVGSTANTRHGTRYFPSELPHDAEKFCNDGRVVLALMEKVCEWGGFDRICPNTTEDFLCTAYRGYGHRRNTENAVNDSLAIAIVEACLDALEGE